MNDLKQLQQRYEELGAEIRRLSEQDDKNWPQIGERYYVIRTNGDISESRFDNDLFDSATKSIGNVFRSQEHAEKEREALQVLAELRRQPGRKSFEYDVDNYFVEIRLSGGLSVSVWRNNMAGFGQVYFNSHQACQSAIQAVGADRILAAARWLAVEKP